MESSNSSRSLPDDVIIEILSRLAVKTLVRFCCVCKFWQNIITSDSFFVRCHLQHSVKNNKNINPISTRNVLLDGGDEYYESCTCHEQPEDLQIKKLTEELSYESDYSRSYRIIFRRGKLSLAGCCDGILCFVKHCLGCNLDRNLTVYLCNPGLHQFRALPGSNYHTKSFGGNTLVCIISGHDDYKVVKIIVCIKSFMVETYSPSSNAWKSFRSVTVSPRGYLLPFGVRSEFVVHNGFPYWFGVGVEQETHILNVLDMNQKKIREIPLPDCLKSFSFSLHLFQIQGFLSITREFSRSSSIRNEVWLLKEDGADISWTKQFVFPTNLSWFAPLSLRTTGLTATGMHLVASFDGCISLYDPENPGEVENCSTKALGDLYDQYVVADFVASLVSVVIPSSLDI